jgi:hypothetical protein
LAWEKQHLINWIETRVIRGIGGVPEAGRPERIDLEIWLAKVRDGLSWQQIALKFFTSKNSASLSKARRAYERVQRSHPGVKQKARKRPGPSQRLRSRIWEAIRD